MDKIEKQNLGIFFFLNDSQAKTTSNTLLLYVVNITCCNKREIGYVCVLGVLITLVWQAAFFSSSSLGGCGDRFSIRA